jgi:hypothetical protein
MTKLNKVFDFLMLLWQEITYNQDQLDDDIPDRDPGLETMFSYDLGKTLPPND